VLVVEQQEKLEEIEKQQEKLEEQKEIEHIKKAADFSRDKLDKLVDRSNKKQEEELQLSYEKCLMSGESKDECSKLRRKQRDYDDENIGKGLAKSAATYGPAALVSGMGLKTALGATAASSGVMPLLMVPGVASVMVAKKLRKMYTENKLEKLKEEYNNEVDEDKREMILDNHLRRENKKFSIEGKEIRYEHLDELNKHFCRKMLKVFYTTTSEGNDRETEITIVSREWNEALKQKNECQQQCYKQKLNEVKDNDSDSPDSGSPEAE